MRTLEQLLLRLAQQRAAEYIYDSDCGFISWRVGTGENLEILFLEVAEKRRGFGTEMFRRMVGRLRGRGYRPYHSVYGFRLASNEDAAKFYESMGCWHTADIGQSVYGGDGTTVFWAKWNDLVEALKI